MRRATSIFLAAAVVVCVLPVSLGAQAQIGWWLAHEGSIDSVVVQCHAKFELEDGTVLGYDYYQYDGPIEDADQQIANQVAAGTGGAVLGGSTLSMAGMDIAWTILQSNTAWIATRVGFWAITGGALGGFAVGAVLGGY